MAMQLLIVEDSAHVRTSLIRLIECIPGVAPIHVADSLASARQQLREMAPALVVLDLQLPDGLGTALLETLRLLTPAVRIAVLTNEANAFNKRRCLQLGADWFFDKSTEFEALLQVVQALAALP
jgi:DNA-binding NarL/FixJ family response regulator